MDQNLNQLGLIDDETIMLDEAALSLALLDHSETDLEPYHDVLAEITSELRAAALSATSARERADALSFVLNGEFGFIGDRDTYDDPANADLIRVIERRRGLPVSLAILYVAAARRLGWTANVLDVPGHVLVLIGNAEDSVMIDPFRGGALVGPDQLFLLVSASSRPPSSDVLDVATMANRSILARLILNQATRAQEAGMGRRALALYRRINAVAPGYGHAWWQRARLELDDHDVAGARSSLVAMLEVTRDPALRETVTATLEALAGS
jgi:regulator of sirC expression with transglutaminase-like and TPR domain